MTAPDNPYFARAAVNRVWARFFGTGIVDPVDDLRADNPPSHPELLDLLARAVPVARLRPQVPDPRDHGDEGVRPDQRRRPLGAGPGEPVRRDAGPHALAGPALRDARPGDRLPRRLAGHFVYRGLREGRFVELFTNRDEKPTEGETSILQALALMNGPLMASVTSLESERHAGRRGRGPLPRHAGADRDALPGGADPPARCPTSWSGSCLTSSAAAPPATAPRHSPTSSGRCLNSPEFRFNH